MKYIYNFIVLLIIASSVIKAMDDKKSSDNSSCYKRYNRNFVNHVLLAEYNNEKSYPELIRLALTCHEYPEQDVVIKTQKILEINPEQAMEGVGFGKDGRGRRSRITTADHIIKRKKKDGCFPTSCAKLLDLIYQTRKQLEQQRQQKEKEKQIEFEKKYQESLANFIKK